MKDYSEQHKKAWEYDAYDFWVRHEGTPEERAREDVADPRKRFNEHPAWENKDLPGEFTAVAIRTDE